jgi:peptide/nickel transport system substrate-binding protein
MSRRSRRSIGVVALVMLLACAMAATAAEKVLVVATEGDVETLDPNFSRYPTANMANLNIYDQFFQYGRDDTGKGYYVTNVKKIEGAAIEKWEVAPDRMSVMLHVRQGVKFAKSGNEMTADDIIYWFEKGKPTNSGIQWNIDTANIAGWEKRGKYDVLIKFSKPLNLFFMLARDQCWGVVDSVEAKKHATDKDPWANEWLAKNDAGAGEYYVENWIPGVQMVLAANKNYWAGKADFDKVILKVIPDSSNRAALLKKGEVDIALGLSPDQMDELRGQPGVNVLSVPSRTEVVVILNCSIPPFNVKEVRQAVSYLVPYETILKDIYKGRALAAKSVIPTLGVYYNPQYWKYETNVAKAKDLLAKAGVPQGFEFTLNIKQGEEISSLLAVTLQSAFAKAGVRVRIREVTNAIWAEEMAKGTHQATLWATGYLSYIDDPWYKLRGFISGSATNRARYNDPRIDKLYEEMQVNFEEKARTAMANQLQEILVNDAPFLWLANIPLDYVLRSDIQGFTFMQDSLLWFYPLKRAGK